MVVCQFLTARRYRISLPIETYGDPDRLELQAFSRLKQLRLIDLLDPFDRLFG